MRRSATTTGGIQHLVPVPGEGRETWEWDAEGNLLAWTDPAGRKTSYTYGPFDLATSRTEPDGTRYEFAYDSELRLTTVTNPQGLCWRYELDAAGRVVAETDFNGRVVGYQYDEAGQLTARINGAGQRVRFTRDLLGRITEQASDDGAFTTFTYAPSGQVIAAANEQTRVLLERDELGRLLREETNGRAVANRYDAVGRRVQRGTPSGAASAWTYDAAGRATRLACDTGGLDFAYDAVGRETLRRLSPAVTLAKEWDTSSRLTALDVATRRGADTVTVLGRRYAYGAGNAVAEITDLDEGSRRFTVDVSDRVTAVTGADWQESYAYDAAGNVVRSALGGGTGDESRTAVGTLVHSAGRHQYSYDGQGRLVRHVHRLLNGQRRTWTYSWDAEDRLTAVVTPDGSNWRYFYDPFGRRVAQERSDSAGQVLERTDFAWDGTRLAEESSGGHHTTWEYAPDSHRPLAQITTQHEYDRRFYAIVTDLTGAPTELLDESGDVAWRMRTTLWGTGTATGRAACPLRFQGQYHDTESGLHYNLERFYDPALGRYLSPDPLGLDAAPNHHAYVPNPLLWADPLGLSPACGGAGADNAANYAKQLRFYEQAQKYGKGGFRELENGRFRFYGTIAQARNPGEMVGRRLVREWDPATDATRIWHETVDHAGNVRIVRPDVKVTGGKKVHYVFDALGNLTGTF